PPLGETWQRRKGFCRNNDLPGARQKRRRLAPGPPGKGQRRACQIALWPTPAASGAGDGPSKEGPLSPAPGGAVPLQRWSGTSTGTVGIVTPIPLNATKKVLGFQQNLWAELLARRAPEGG